ncbi:hypothetical protein [Photorhabdus asymbiotica]|uniref:hypothetical protein n=1 Tax=Photorhabdus asymbiotica TaxID=291112 RepID=UPI003DA7265E
MAEKKQINREVYARLQKLAVIPKGITPERLTEPQIEAVKLASAVVNHWDNYPNIHILFGPEWSVMISRHLISALRERDALLTQLDSLGIVPAKPVSDFQPLSFSELMKKLSVAKE